MISDKKVNTCIMMIAHLSMINDNVISNMRINDNEQNASPIHYSIVMLHKI